MDEVTLDLIQSGSKSSEVGSKRYWSFGETQLINCVNRFRRRISSMCSFEDS